MFGAGKIEKSRLKLKAFEEAVTKLQAYLFLSVHRQFG